MNCTRLHAKAKQAQSCMNLSQKIFLSTSSRVTRQVLRRSKSTTIQVKKLWFIKKRNYLVLSCIKIGVRSSKNLFRNTLSKFLSKAQRRSLKDSMKANFRLHLAKAKHHLSLTKHLSRIVCLSSNKSIKSRKNQV